MNQFGRPVRPAGATQSGLRDHNSRLLLSLIRDKGPIAASDLARGTSLSAQTVSVIVRDLEARGLVRRGDPLRGRVGKPSTPIMLAPDGVWSLGLKIGRRTADIALSDLAGRLRKRLRLTYRYPMPERVFDFLRDGLKSYQEEYPVHGLGVAVPYEMWKWEDAIGAPKHEIAAWRTTDIAGAISRFCDLPVIVMNDATAACRAEHNLEGGPRHRDYAYFYVGAFIGGGVVMNRTVIDGNQGNAGALGSLVTIGPSGAPVQLLDVASLHVLERRIEADGADPSTLWTGGADWSDFEEHVADWIGEAADALAQAAVSACSVIDFSGVVIDGAFPQGIRGRLVSATRERLAGLDTRGIVPPAILEGRIGRDARALGAAYAPISADFFLDEAGSGQPDTGFHRPRPGL